MERKVLSCGCSITRDERLPFRFIKYCDVHAKEHGIEVEIETHLVTNTPMFKATDADLEKAAFLLKGRVSNVNEISKSVGMKEVKVALSIKELIEKGIVGVTPHHHPHKYFFNP